MHAAAAEAESSGPVQADQRVVPVDLAAAGAAVTFLPVARAAYYYFGSRDKKEKKMAVFAVVNPGGGEVTNLVIGDSLESVTELVGGAVEVTEQTGSASIGGTWDPETGKFTIPGSGRN